MWGFVRDANIYVQNLGDGRINALTHDGNPERINGTFDWVYEEEFSIRDGFRWSPDGLSVAYWQLENDRDEGITCSSTRPTTSTLN